MEETPWMSHAKPLVPLPLPMKDDIKHPIWQNPPEQSQVPESEKQGHLIDGKVDLHAKVGPFGM